MSMFRQTPQFAHEKADVCTSFRLRHGIHKLHHFSFEFSEGFYQFFLGRLRQPVTNLEISPRFCIESFTESGNGRPVEALSHLCEKC